MSLYDLVNPVMTKMLRSPLHGIVSKTIMAVSFQGVKSGKSYTVPVSYYMNGDSVYCFTNGGWWKNFKQTLPVTLRIRGKDIVGRGKAKTDDLQEQVELMQRYFEAVPGDKKYYGLAGTPSKAQIEAAAKSVIAIEIDISP